MVGTLLLLNGTTLEEQDDEVVTLTVVTKEERPYVMLRAGMEGNDAYDGFAIDLLKVGGTVHTLLLHHQYSAKISPSPTVGRKLGTNCILRSRIHTIQMGEH